MTPMLRSLTLALALTLVACTTNGSKAPASGINASNIPAAIAAPSGNRLVFTLKASGLQNYECRAAAGRDGGYGWVFVAPDAALYDRSDTQVGRHYAGPTWEYGDDSKVTGKVVADSAAPQAGNIPWLLLQGTPAARGGVLSGVTYIQRVNTNGGVAPDEPCSAATVGTRKGVRYSADYLFYKS